MPKSLNEKLSALSKRRQVAIQNRADQLVSEEMTLRDLRLALRKTQKDLENTFHMSQYGISRLENRSDILLSTLNKYISALGGRLTIKAEFPNRPSVTINGFSDLHA